MNKIAFTILILAGCLLATNVQGECTPSVTGGCIEREKGTIRLVSPDTDWYVIVPDFDETQRFLPENLPDEMREDGFRVIFSGTIGEIPANMRLIGIPFELTEIEILD